MADAVSGGRFGAPGTGFTGFGPKPPIGPSTSLFGNPSSFTAAADTQAKDYDTIMKSYGDFISKASGSPITSTNITPQVVNPTQSQYSQSPDVTGSIKNLSDLSQTGGYSDANIADIRARDISPIRSIYANAQQNVERQRALGGGYSPNFNATQAQMARDESDQIADKTTAVNAGIAQNVASNKLAAASPYAQASAEANRAQTQSSQFNADALNRTAEGNANRFMEANTGNANRNLEAQFGQRRDILSGIEGQRNLYGTTPALTRTFGDQVMQAQQSGQNQQQIDEQKNRNLFQGMHG